VSQFLAGVVATLALVMGGRLTYKAYRRLVVRRSLRASSASLRAALSREMSHG
jgi:hypothetical protein